MDGQTSRQCWRNEKPYEPGCLLGPSSNCFDLCGINPKDCLQHLELVDPNHFEVRVNLHTPDAVRAVGFPECLREIVGSSLDTCGLQEEIDYTLEVRRDFEIRRT